MKLFMTVETQKDTYDVLMEILLDIGKKLSFVTNKNACLADINNYGTEFRIISIIPTCLDDNFWK